MAKFMLIGGGDVGRCNTSYETYEIDKRIVLETGKSNPNFLFVGLASSFSDSYFDTMKKIYKDLGCECVYLKKKNIINNPDIVKDKINNADIIYFCGGDSVKLVNDLKEYGIDKLLLEKINNSDCIIAGISAGAIMCSRDGYSDSLKIRGESDKYDFVDGLGFVNISFCPHFVLGGERALELVDDLSNSDKNVYCIEDKVALFVDDNSCEIIRCDNGNGYLFNNREFKLLNDTFNI